MSAAKLKAYEKILSAINHLKVTRGESAVTVQLCHQNKAEIILFEDGYPNVYKISITSNGSIRSNFTGKAITYETFPAWQEAHAI